MPARIQKTVTPLPERLVNRTAQGFEALPGTKFDRTGLGNVRMTPATMARALEYLLSMFTNAKEVSPQICSNSSAKRLQIPLTGVVERFSFLPVRSGAPCAYRPSCSAQ